MHTTGGKKSETGKNWKSRKPRFLVVMGPILGPKPVDFWVIFGVDFGVVKVGGLVIVCALTKIERKQWHSGPMAERKNRARHGPLLMLLSA